MSELTAEVIDSTRNELVVRSRQTKMLSTSTRELMSRAAGALDQLRAVPRIAVLDARTTAVLALGEEVLRLFRADQALRAPATWYAIESGDGWSDRSSLSVDLVRDAAVLPGEGGK